ncbi:NHL repeat-containing protein [Novimethylophilus kurashikiensis]|uniref:NHL repeat-containing protein n=1 Tax=Novimethylophilus kurashikiensis TaxID=1825523 RepID=A0A2R5F3Y5_9PROT|nr:hypothetical protein [Novimethylophilus kurashikiensis]GBG12498.1 NHL repeat-containing protein [Novimethylophilus kurashikiensis]
MHHVQLPQWLSQLVSDNAARLRGRDARSLNLNPTEIGGFGFPHYAELSSSEIFSAGKNPLSVL